MGTTSFYSGYKKSTDSKPFRMANSSLGSPTSPMHAKQLEEFGKRLNEGIQNIEIGTLDASKFEYIPKEHFEAIRQLAQLTGTKPSLHGALVDLAGFDGQRGGVWSEENRASTTKQVYSFIERAQAMDPTGDLPLVFHAGATTSQEYDESLRKDYAKAYEQTKRDYNKISPEEVPIRMMTIVNQDTGQVQPVEFEKRYRPDKPMDQPDIWTPFQRLHSMNETQWDEEKLKLFNYQKELAQLAERAELMQRQQEALVRSGLITVDKEGKIEATIPEYKQKAEALQYDFPVVRDHIGEISNRFHSALSEAFDKVVKFKPEDTSPAEHQQQVQHLQRGFEKFNEFQKENKALAEKLKERYNQAKTREEQLKILNEPANKKYQETVEGMREISQKILLQDISKIDTPQIWRPVKDFAKEKTAQTVAEAMHMAYKQFGEKSPFMAIENFWPNTAMSTGAELRDAVMQARAQLTHKLVNIEHKSEKEAKQIAEKLIGATWDVGHINNLRKAGFEGEALQKKVIEETQRVADVTRHVHITDNFGFHDSHLPPGMGIVPVAEMMAALKEGGFKGRGIVEAGGFVAEIGGNPMQDILSFFESPLYKMGPGPYWSDLQKSQASYANYTSNFIDFPQNHFNLYGSSFTTLPKELGGQMGGDRTRFSDTPNA